MRHKREMKIAFSSYVVIQTLFIVAWMVGLFNISVLFALTPTFVAVSVIAAMVGFLKLIEFFLGFDDDDDSICIPGLDEPDKDEEED